MTQIAGTGWRLSDDACAIVDKLVRDHQPDLIVECGSGRSTVTLAQAAAPYGGRVVALEHDEHYLAETKALLADTRTIAAVRHAPLEPHGGALPPRWYAQAAWEDLDGIGMLFVDGPPGHTGRWARSPAVPLLRDQMLPNCLIVLDDAQRDDEREIIVQWGIAMTLVTHAKGSLAYGTLA